MATPQELMQVFPIRKIYDGSRWETKDYFSTMEAIQKYGLDIPIGLNIDDFLWEYMNDDLMDFEINRMSAMSKIYKQETGKGIMEKFLEDKGISPMYLCRNKETGKGFLYDVENGKTFSTRKSLPKGWKVIESEQHI